MTPRPRDAGKPADRGVESAYGSGAPVLPDFAEAVLDIVDQIPAGMVLTYGDIAELLGTGGPRQVGSVLSRYGSSVPWWRVIRANGDAPQGLREEALAHWRDEGTVLVRGGLLGRRVDMNRARWDGVGWLEETDRSGSGEGKKIVLNDVDPT